MPLLTFGAVEKTDFLVIGSGIAGLVYALRVADHGSVTIITKDNEDESNTKYAQGGIAAVTSMPDSYEKHVQDTLTCGAGACDEEVVRMVIEQSPEGIKELINWGVEFDRSRDGEFDLAKEGGHSEHRILHHKDITGYEIERALLDRIANHPNIRVKSHHFAIDLITQHHLGESVTKSNKDITCFGAYIFDQRSGKIDTMLSRVTLMASGGVGQVYATTTNPVIATGDGIAMVYRAKGQVKDMEFVQFHPTSLYQPGVSPSFLITEALRGHGAILRDHRGEDFMPGYDSRGSLAPRDIVARAIDNEIKLKGIDHVWLDCTSISKDELLEKFPNILNKCLSLGIDITCDFIPVVPAAHYLCGGIATDAWGRSTILNLFAAGECARTGLHGANRLASNSLLEAVVFANRASQEAVRMLDSITFRDGIPAWDDRGTEAPEELILITQTRKELQQIMTAYVGIVRSGVRLARAKRRLFLLHEETESLYKRTTISVKLCELRNLINTAYLIIKASELRKENTGLYFNVDYYA